MNENACRIKGIVSVDFSLDLFVFLIQTVEMNVHMDCDGCEKRVRKAMSRLEGMDRAEKHRTKCRFKLLTRVQAVVLQG